MARLMVSILPRIWRLNLDAINMKDFKDAPYSLAAINAYFHLKNMEVARVVTALECIRYGYKPEAISQYINQKRGVL